MGAKVMFAGHTHGGQICLPGGKALITNCDLPTDQAQGISKHQNSWLHVSGGMGANIYTPLRLFCPPSATLLTIS
jgi:predicted MPP superfamily phosphohydrolase